MRKRFRSLQPIQAEFDKYLSTRPSEATAVGFYKILRNPGLTESDCVNQTQSNCLQLSQCNIAQTVGRSFANRIGPAAYPDLDAPIERYIRATMAETPGGGEAHERALSELRAVIRLQSILMIEGGGDQRQPSDVVTDAAEYIARVVQLKQDEAELQRRRRGRPRPAPPGANCVLEGLDLNLLLRTEVARNPLLILDGRCAFALLMLWFRTLRDELDDNNRLNHRIKQMTGSRGDPVDFNRMYADIVLDPDFVPTEQLPRAVVERAVAARERPLGSRQVLACVRRLESLLFGNDLAAPLR